MCSLVKQAQNKGLVLDGAMSTALEKQGIDTDNKLWTATALIDQLPAVYNVHMDYFKAGAQLTITDTYQANVQAFEKAGFSGAAAKKLITDAVKVAKQSRDDFEAATGKHNFVAGTIGPYGAYLADGNEYRGDYQLTAQEYLRFHLPRLQTILAAQPDCLAIETQPRVDEPVALLDWLTANAPEMPVYVSFTLHDTQTISDGTSLAEAVATIDKYHQVFAIGINCVTPLVVTAAIDEIKQATAKPVVVYPNLGASYNPQSKQWEPIKHQFDFNALAEEWYQHGARLIGGCCTTGPAQIRAITSFYQNL